VALSALNTALSSVAVSHKLVKTVKALGAGIAGEAWAHDLLVSNGKLHDRIKKAVSARHGNLKYRKQAARSIAARAGFRQKRWTPDEIVRAGEWLLDILLTALPEVFELQRDTDGNPVLGVSTQALEQAEAAVELAVQANPVFVPTTEPPKPWTGISNGGYWDERTRLRTNAVRTVHRETEAAIRNAIRDGSMKPHLDAMNALQAVPFKINRRILGVINLCYLKGIPVKGLPSKRDVDEPVKSRPWHDMTDDEKTVWKAEASKIKEHNRTLHGNRLLFKQDVETAKLLAGAERFYTPLNCDWRGRFYGVPHFNFQRDDRVRALFLFADGEPLGEDGLRWLKIHTANCGDFDKISKQPLDARVAWADVNLEKIIECAEHPLEPSSTCFWMEADKPFLFLAACMELAEAVKSPNPTNFTTHLPVSFDGSCSGLQHLAAMTRDEQTGVLVNLTPLPTPQDVYQTIADEVRGKVQAEADEGSPIARLALTFGITRKVVKRNVMTYSYSSKKFGMAQQQDEDLIDPLSFDVLSGKIKEHPFGVWAEKAHRKATTPAAKYLAEHVYASIQQTVKLPEQAMVFLQKIARALAHEGKPVTWRTPTGLPWVNRYHDPVVKRVELWLHDTRIRLSVAHDMMKEIDKDRAANGVAPNFVHSLDASHLALVANAAVAEGITSIATVHDSFGCLASRATRFGQIIREQFVRMYTEHDVLAEVLEAAKRDLTVHNWQRLPEGLQYGNLKLEDVTKAQYAFA
jgi:DNA-directed RNA polymerase